MSSALGIPTRGEKGKSKYVALDINNLYKGKSIEIQKSTVVPKYGLQTLGKITAGRRMPPPANLPSLKSENSGNNPNINLVPCGGQGWGSSAEENLSLQSSQPSPLSSVSSTTQKECGGGGGKTWSSVCSPAGGLQSPNAFPKEFPELKAQDTTDQPGNSTSQLSLRPQSSGNWSQGSKPADPPPSSGNGDKGGILPGGMKSDAEPGRRGSPGVGPEPLLPQPPSDRTRLNSLEKKKNSQIDYNRGKPYVEGPSAAIVCEKDLQVFDEILQDPKSSWSTSTNEIDYNARLDFCEDEDDDAVGSPLAEVIEERSKMLPPKEHLIPELTKDITRSVDKIVEEPVQLAKRPPPKEILHYPNHHSWAGVKEIPPQPIAPHYDMMRGYAPQSANWMPSAPPPQPCGYRPTPHNRPPLPYQHYPPQTQLRMNYPRNVSGLQDDEQLWAQYGKQHTSEMTAAVERARQRRFEEEKLLEISKRATAYKPEEKDLQTFEAHELSNYKNTNQLQQRHFNKELPPRFQKQVEMRQQSNFYQPPLPTTEPKLEKPGPTIPFRNQPQQFHPENWLPAKEEEVEKMPALLPHAPGGMVPKVNTEVFYNKDTEDKPAEVLKPPIIGAFMPRGETARYGRGGVIISAPPRSAVSNYGPPPLKSGFGPKKEEDLKIGSTAPPMGAIATSKLEDKKVSSAAESGSAYLSAGSPTVSKMTDVRNQAPNSGGGGGIANKSNGHFKGGEGLANNTSLPPRFQRKQQKQPQGYQFSRGKQQQRYYKDGDINTKESGNKEENAPRPKNSFRPGHNSEGGEYRSDNRRDNRGGNDRSDNRGGNDRSDNRGGNDRSDNRGGGSDNRSDHRGGGNDNRSDNRGGGSDNRSDHRGGGNDNRSNNRGGGSDNRSDHRGGGNDNRSDNRGGGSDNRSDHRGGGNDNRSDNRGGNDNRSDNRGGGNNRRWGRNNNGGGRGRGGGNREEQPNPHSQPKTDEDAQAQQIRRQMEKVSLGPSHQNVKTPPAPPALPISNDCQFNEPPKQRGPPFKDASKKMPPPRKDGGGKGGNGRFREKKLPPRFAKQKELEKIKAAEGNNAGSPPPP